MRRLTTICILAATYVLYGCTPINIDEVLLQRDDISITVKGVLHMSFNEATCQLGYNGKKNEFRVLEDNIGNWFVLTCSERPSATGQEVICSLNWTSSTDTESLKGLNFTVKNLNENGMIWLWCQSEEIGVVVKEL
ncbi:MAG: hypothetical protein IJ005_04585 [Bacteroidales bacterium]|nr:hypothetical protein [Bacteroidales bacterium]